jgi:hypothetical protein
MARGKPLPSLPCLPCLPLAREPWVSISWPRRRGGRLSVVSCGCGWRTAPRQQQQQQQRERWDAVRQACPASTTTAPLHRWYRSTIVNLCAPTGG